MTLWQAFVLNWWMDSKVEKAAKEAKCVKEIDWCAERDTTVNAQIAEAQAHIKNNPPTPLTRKEKRTVAFMWVFMLVFFALAVFCAVHFRFLYAVLSFCIIWIPLLNFPHRPTS
jgi:hypothetical protein